MKSWLGVGGVVLVGLVLFAVVFTAAAGSYSTSTVNYRLGQTLLFRIQEQPSNCCWCCQPCPTTQVLGWRITDACGKVIYSVTYNAPISASTWQEKWPEVDIAAVDKAEAQVESASPGLVYQAWQNAMSTYEKYWKGVETPVSPGCYILYVDTSAGTLSRCLRLYDPMNPCQPCGYCPCEQPTIRPGCYCRTTLLVSVEQPARYRPLSWQPCCSCQWP